MLLALFLTRLALDDDDGGVIGRISLDKRIRSSVFGIKKMKLVELGIIGSYDEGKAFDKRLRFGSKD
ncbi:hypothetical protein Tco_0870146 [Tanacetum coccineum]